VETWSESASERDGTVPGSFGKVAGRSKQTGSLLGITFAFVYSIAFCIRACRAVVMRSSVSCRCALEMGSVTFAAFNTS